MGQWFGLRRIHDMHKDASLVVCFETLYQHLKGHGEFDLPPDSAPQDHSFFLWSTTASTTCRITLCALRHPVASQ